MKLVSSSTEKWIYCGIMKKVLEVHSLTSQSPPLPLQLSLSRKCLLKLPTTRRKSFRQKTNSRIFYPSLSLIMLYGKRIRSRLLLRKEKETKIHFCVLQRFSSDSFHWETKKMFGINLEKLNSSRIWTQSYGKLFFLNTHIRNIKMYTKTSPDPSVSHKIS